MTSERMSDFGLAARLARREARVNGRLLLAMGLAIATGVAAMVAIGSLGQRVEQAIALRSGELLGGTLRISARHDLRPWAAALPARLRPAVTLVETPTMVLAAARTQLVELKVVPADYPLLGALRIAAGGTTRVAGAPPPGSVWVEPVLLQQLDLAVGDSLQVGYSSLTIGGVIEHEPDRIAGAFSLGPRVMMNMADLGKSGLVQPGSRIRTVLLYDALADAKRLADELAARLPPGAQLDKAADGLDQTRTLVRQATDYLRLTAFAGLLLAAVAVSLIANTLVTQRRDAVAVLKALGARQRLVMACYLGLALGVAVGAGALGAAAGLGLERALPALLGDLLPKAIFAGSLRVDLLAALRGTVAAGLTCLLFAYAPLRRLANTPPNRVLRQPGAGAEVAGGTPWRRGLGALAGAGAFALLLAWQAGDWRFGLYGGVGVVVLWALLWALSRLSLAGALGLSGRMPLALRQGIAGLAGGQAALPLAALALGTLALLAPVLLQQGLVSQWQARAPADAPNQFLIDVQPDQRASVAALLQRHGAADAWLRPVVRARLVSVDGVPTAEIPKVNERARRLAQRENNLSFGDPDPYNRLVAGAWWQGKPATPEISLEQEWARLMGAKLGSELVFEVQGQQVRGRVTSLRQVDWESLRSNFFVLFSPGALDGLPTTYLTSYRIAPQRRAELQQALVSAYPNVTVIDIQQMLDTVQGVVSRVSGAIGLLGALTAAAGFAVLFAVVVAQRATMAREAAVLRTLGATARQVRSLFAARFALLGLLATLLGSSCAVVLATMLSSRLLDTDYAPDWRLLGAALALGCALVTLAGLTSSRRVLTRPPLATLREGVG